MDLIELYVIFGNSANEEWENVAKLDIDYEVQPDLSQGPEALKEYQRNRFRRIALPNGETIELAVLYHQEAESFALEIRQGKDTVLQVLCEGKPQIVFRTLSGTHINIQVHSRGYFEAEGNGERCT
jgi:hypothetical protein